MTWVVTQRGEDDFLFVSTCVIPAFIPAAGNLLFLIVGSDEDVDMTGVAGHADGAGWTKIEHITNNTDRLQVWVCKVESSPLSGTVTGTFSGGKRGAGICIEVSGQDTALTAVNAVIQTSTGAVYDVSSIGVSPALSAFASATNLTLFALARCSNSAVESFTPDAGFTEAIESSTGRAVALHYQAAEDTTPTSTIVGYNFSYFESIAFEIAEVTAPTSAIVSITDPLADGAVSASLTTTLFTGDITTLTITGDQSGGGTSTLSGSLSGTGDNYTFNADDISALSSITAGAPFDTAYWSNTATAGDGTDTDDIAVVRTVKSDWEVIDVASATTVEGTVGYLWGAAPADNSQWYYPTADNTSISPDGTIYTDKLSGSITCVIFNVATGNWDPFSINLDAAVVICGRTVAATRTVATTRSIAAARTIAAARAPCV